MSKNKSIHWFPVRNWIGEVNFKSVRSDLLAGLTGSIIVLPQGVAFAIIAGLPPIHGLYTAMIFPIVAAFFGSSRYLISGPTVAISLIVFSTVSNYAEPSTPDFVSLAIVVTLVSGVIQLLLGFAKLGAIVNFVSNSVIIGFTAGAAILIATSQFKYLLGIDIPRGGAFLDTWIMLFQRINETNLIVLGIGLCALISAVLIRLIHPMIPNLLLAIILSSFVAYYFFSGESSIVLVGKLPQGLPHFEIPKISIEQLKSITPNAFAIALLGLIQSVAIGRSMADKTAHRINANQEFIGQGLSNIMSSLFSGYAGSGSFTRSAINKSAGAITPMASMFSALFLLLAISYIAPLAAYLPITVMAGLIIMVAYNLIDFRYIKKLFMTSRRESSVMIITFLSVLLLEVDYAIYLGVFFSLVLYLRQTTQPRFVELAPDPENARHMFVSVSKYNLETCPQLMIIRIEGSLYFGAVEHVADKLDELLMREENHLLIVSNNINLIDNAGAQFIVKEVEKWEEGGKQIYFSGLKLRSREFLRNGGYVKQMGIDRFFGNKEHAVEEIYKRLNENSCRDCKVQLFRECPKRKI